MAIEFRYLNQEEVAQLGGLDMAATVKDMEEVFRLFIMVPEIWTGA